MNKVYLLNAFSLQMLEGDAIVRFTEVSSDEVFTVGDCETESSFDWENLPANDDSDEFCEFDWSDFEALSAHDAPGMFLRPGIKSAIGHHDTANILGVEMNRINVTLKKGDTAFVAQLQGGRLPEGCTILPEGSSFKYIKVEVL